MNVYKRGKSFYYDFRLRKTRYRGCFGPVTREDAIRAAALLKQQAATDHLPGHQKKPEYTWEQMRDGLLLYTENNCRPKTTLRMREVAIKSLEPFFRDIDPKDIKPADIERYKQAQLARGLSKSTINIYLRPLRQMLGMAYEAGHLQEPPIRKFRMIPYATNHRTRVYSHEEEARLLLACPADLRAKVILALNTGMRRGELNTLKWEAVDLEKRLITIRSQYSKNHQEGLVPLNGVAFSLLSDLKQNAPDDWVFRDRTSGSGFLRARAKAGLDPELKFHSTRHTFGTRLYEAGVVLVTVKELMRHADVAMTLRYTHARIDHLRRAVDLLGAAPTPIGVSITA